MIVGEPANWLISLIRAAIYGPMMIRSSRDIVDVIVMVHVLLPRSHRTIVIGLVHAPRRARNQQRADYREKEQISPHLRGNIAICPHPQCGRHKRAGAPVNQNGAVPPEISASELVLTERVAGIEHELAFLAAEARILFADINRSS
jgi:hypothetical protein